MKIKYHLLILTLLVLNAGYSQKSVLSTLAQGYVSGDCTNLFMSATIGQVISGTADCGPYKVIIGFQQPPDILSTPIPDHVFNKVILFPNPAEDFISVQGDLKTAHKNLNIKIIDMMGKQLITKIVKQFQNQYTIDIHSIPPGIYSILLSNAETNLQSLLFIKK